MIVLEDVLGLVAGNAEKLELVDGEHLLVTWGGSPRDWAELVELEPQTYWTLVEDCIGGDGADLAGLFRIGWLLGARYGHPGVRRVER